MACFRRRTGELGVQDRESGKRLGRCDKFCRDLLRKVHPTGRKSSPLAPYSRTVLYTKKPTLLNQQTHHGVPLRSSSHTYVRAWKRKVGRPRADRRGRLYDRTTAFIGAIKWQALTSLATRTVGQGAPVEHFTTRLNALGRAQALLSRSGNDTVEGSVGGVTL